MSIWQNLHRFKASASQTTDEPRRVPMRQSCPIEVDGVFLGAAVEHELGVRFIAIDVRVSEMDQSIWPTFDYARRSAHQMFRSARATQPF